MNYVKFATLPQASTTIKIQPFAPRSDVSRRGAGDGINLFKENVWRIIV
ncbi:hypothetical protein PEC331060_16290 [Pectobacterium carotovorum subsp. carotovorum]|nr:hypothetical protein PEC301653_25010 [Pectobacterium carotovorum subsp. carotovorum]GKW28451.1 hypothetical protein PEC331060_16290 [Pectobacterium carotovorum subsp. carotovorum]